jgi:hypothetical protein
MLVDILFDLILLSTVPPISTKQTTSSYLKQYNMQLSWELFVISTWKENYSYPVYADWLAGPAPPAMLLLKDTHII